MASELVQSAEVQQLLDRVAGLDAEGGDPRKKAIMRRIVSEIFSIIDEFDVSEDEFWHALNFLVAGAPELGLWVPGLGIERFLDIRADIADQARGILHVTPRTIEGPLYVPGAPLAKGEARLDDGTDKGEVLVMHGQVRDPEGKPIAGAVVDVWHANTTGNYSYFDPSQSAYNNRRRIETDAEGRYRFRSILPAGYAVPPGGTAEKLLQAIGRHGNRPAHVHFFVSAPGHRHLTTQINIAGDPFLHDDFAYATREELIPEVERQEDPDAIHAAGLNEPFCEISFDFVLGKADSEAEEGLSTRPRVPAIA
jgi:catechol 1,2-dioxygenase